ncbi:MAG: phospholipase D-like domain-containing protein [Bacteroidota bacterium]
MKSRSIRRNYNKPYTPGHSIEWIQSGKEYYDNLVAIIDSASVEIQLQTYIFNDDRTGKKIGDALINAAKRGVNIYVVIDAYGSQGMSAAYQKTLMNAGINIKRYGEIFSRGRFHISRRLHRKVLVVDSSIAVVGGINISDHYAGTSKHPAWLDFAVIVKGKIGLRLEMICRKRWKSITFPKKKGLENLTENPDHTVAVRVRRNDFIRNQNEIAISYRQAIRHAEKSLLFVGGYFLPGGRTRRLIRNAVRRGVDVCVLVAEKSDVGIMVHARRYLYNWLTTNGIRVFEYKPSNVHGKVLIRDDKWTSIGSYDLNNLSTYSNIELNLDINNSRFSESLGMHIRHIIAKESTEVTVQSTLLKRNIFTRFTAWASYRFVKIMFVLSFILAGKHEKDF